MSGVFTKAQRGLGRCKTGRLTTCNTSNSSKMRHKHRKVGRMRQKCAGTARIRLCPILTAAPAAKGLGLYARHRHPARRISKYTSHQYLPRQSDARRTSEYTPNPPKKFGKPANNPRIPVRPPFAATFCTQTPQICQGNPQKMHHAGTLIAGLPLADSAIRVTQVPSTPV